MICYVKFDLSKAKDRERFNLIAGSVASGASGDPAEEPDANDLDFPPKVKPESPEENFPTVDEVSSAFKSAQETNPAKAAEIMKTFLAKEGVPSVRNLTGYQRQVLKTDLESMREMETFF